MTNGRVQRKFVETIVLDTADQKYISRLPRDRYSAGFRLTFRGRLRVTAAATTVLPEGILNLVERLRLNLNHQIFKAQTPLDVDGPTLAAYRQIYGGVPIFAQVDPTLSTAVGEYDFVFVLDYQHTPEIIFPADQQFFEMDAPRLTSYDLEIEWGNADSVVEGGTTSLTNFGATTGSPEVDVELFEVLDRENLPLRSIIKRVASDDALATAIGGAGANNVGRVIATDTFPIGETIRSLLLKQYVRSATAGQPLTAVATLRDPVEPGVDNGLGVVMLRVNERPIQHYPSWQALRRENEMVYRSSPMPLGYGIIDFVQVANIDRVLFTSDFPEKRLRLDLAGSVVGVTDQRLERLFTTILDNPQIVAG